MPFDIDYYLSEFEDNITFLDLSNKHLKILPDLSRFTHLRRLDCQFNRLIHLQHLPISLIVLNCSHNRLHRPKRKMRQNIFMICIFYNYVSDNLLDVPLLFSSLKYLKLPYKYLRKYLDFLF
jgi:Leucine-rich repeat (LRR) protein